MVTLNRENEPDFFVRSAHSRAAGPNPVQASLESILTRIHVQPGTTDLHQSFITDARPFASVASHMLAAPASSLAQAAD